jgi:predicted house-cleaning noncanonical NTP pyrophosphatase (MazG superfamily)
MKYDKLVRDKIPELIRARGDFPVTHTATNEEYWQKLREKLKEEAEEFAREPSVEELADLLEVVSAIIAHQRWPMDEIQEAERRKVVERGRFSEKIILEEA